MASDPTKIVQSVDNGYFRIVKSVHAVCRDVLYKIFLWGCPKPVNQTLEQYLKKMDKKKWTGNFYRNFFDKQKREKITKNASGNVFDVALLYYAIRVSCNNLAPSNSDVWDIKDENRIEYFLTEAKEFRKNVFHTPEDYGDPHVVNRLEELRELLDNILTKGCQIYNKEDELKTLKQMVMTDIDRIRNAVLEYKDLKYNKELVIKVGPNELKQMLKQLSRTLPIYGCQNKTFLGGKPMLPLVYTDFQVVDQDNHRVGPILSYIDILKLVNDDNDDYKGDDCDTNSDDNDDCKGDDCDTNSDDNDITDDGINDSDYDNNIGANYININGDDDIDIDLHPICDKTGNLIIIEESDFYSISAFLKLVINQWMNEGECSIIGLKDYELLLFADSGNKSVLTFKDLLKLSMPIVSNRMDIRDFINCCQSLKILIIFNNTDSLNEVSRNLFEEVLELSCNYNITILCTVSTDKLNLIKMLIPSSLKNIVIKNLGINNCNRMNFVETYHNRYVECNPNKSLNDIEDLHKIKKYCTDCKLKVGNHFKCPLNLVLLTSMVLKKSDKNAQLVTTVTSLYEQTCNLFIDNIKETLLKSQQFNINIQDILTIIQDEALNMIPLNDTIFSAKTILKLKQMCENEDLIYQIVTTFLSLQPTTVDESKLNYLSFTYKELQHFYAAKSLLNKITEPDNSDVLDNWDDCSANKSILSVLQSLSIQANNNHFDLRKYKQILLHLTGLICEFNTPLIEDFVDELVELSKMWGIQDVANFFELITEANYNPDMVKLIARDITKDKWIIEDNNLLSAYTLLHQCVPNRICLELNESPRDLVNLLKLLKYIGGLECNAEFRLQSHFQRFSSSDDQEYSDQYFQHLINAKCKLRVVVGALSVGAIGTLPNSLLQLHLCIYCNEAAEDLINLNLTQLQNNGIGIYMKRNVDPSYIPSIHHCICTLYLCDLTDDEQDITWACQVTAALQKQQKWQYTELKISSSSLTIKGINILLKEMYKLGIKIKNRLCGGVIQISSTNLNDNHKLQLKELAKDLWNCLCVLKDDTSIWGLA